MPFDALDPGVTEALRAWRMQESAGVALEKTFATAAGSCGSLEAQRCFLEASRRAVSGAAPHELIEAFEPILPPAERAVLAAGFRTGRLDRMLDCLISRRELWHRARRQIRAKLLLPIGILAAASVIAPLPGLILGGSTLLFVVGMALPLSAAFVLWRAANAFIRARQFAQASGETAAPESRIDGLLLSIPLVARFERLRNLGEFASVLGHLTGAGVLLSESLGICAATLPNGRYRSAASRLADGARSGRTLSECLSADPAWPQELTTAFSVGERSGTLEEACLRLAAAYREDYQRAVDQLADWVPRILYLLVALFVVFCIAMLALNVAASIRDAMNG